MNVLCLDHVCHRKTKSFDFFVEVLWSAGSSVDVFYYDRHYCVNLPDEKVRWADVIVYLEFLPSRFRLIFPGKPCVFVPMYDNEWGSMWQWRRIAWSGMGVISFCGKVSAHARRCSVKNLLDVRYFPNPVDLPQTQGDPKRVFLWERGEIGKYVAEKLFPPSNGYVIDIKRHDEFLERSAYLERLSRCGIFMAPRRKEGIGMAFLEAMAMGKCVVAHNEATMNEYIVDGESGILFNADAPVPVSRDAVARVLDSVPSIAKGHYARWQRDTNTISPFLFSQPPCHPSFNNRLKIALSYLIYLVEGAIHILLQKWNVRGLFKKR